jgi:hypothetical protein
MASKKAERDWFEALNDLVDKERTEFDRNVNTFNARKADVNKVVLNDLVKVWQKFDELRIHFTLDPDPHEFAVFDEHFKTWTIKSSFDFASVNSIGLRDRTQEGGRVGDAVRAWFYNFENETRFRVVFEFCEGEHYYKYSGWKRIFAQHILYDAPIEKVNFDLIHEVFTDVFKKWFESHLKKARDVVVKHIKDTYEKGESFTQ